MKKSEAEGTTKTAVDPSTEAEADTATEGAAEKEKELVSDETMLADGLRTKVHLEDSQ